MKIAQISGAYAGAQKIIERAIHKESLSRGYESRIWYAVGNSADAEILCYENKISSLFRRALRKYIGKNPHFSRWSTVQLIRQLKAYQPDLVHLHVLHQGYLDYETLFEYLIDQRIPVVYTAHDMWAFTGGCYYYTKEGCTGFLNGCCECPADPKRLDNPRDKTAFYFELKKKLISQLDSVRFVAVSKWVADELKKSFLSEYPIIVIENGVDLHSSLPSVAVQKEKCKPFVLLGVATSWDERKGIHRIFEMAPLLGDDYQFHLVGSASEQIKEKAPPNVCFLGYVNDKERLLQLYTNADLHISASMEETFGMTFIEAAFCGTRSVGYNSTAIVETLNGVYGHVVNDVTAEAMACAIEAVFSHDNIKLNKDEIDKVIERYSSNAMSKKYVDLYGEFLLNKREKNEK